VRGWRGAGRERRLGGRERECSRIDAAVRTAREGGSAVVVLRGESGIGKTALLDYAVATADGLSVLRTAGKDTEQERPFTGLGDLCRPLVEDIARLRPARAGPLAAALGLAGDAVAGDRFAVYAGVLDLLTTVAYERPLLLAVDDAHLLDDASAEAVRFVAQHLGADGIALLVGTEADEDFPDLEEVRLGGLDRPAARALLEARFGDQLASDVADAVVEAARGNPLALLEIPPGLTLDQQAGREPIETLPSSVEWAFLGRIAGLPPEGRSALVVAALAEDGDLEAVGRACAALGIDASALDTAERAGLVRSDDGRLTFRHGLVRTAVAYSALRADRRNAHAALAGIVGGDARLWHLARAAAGPDEDLAAGLERAAWNARERRAHAAAARALELAAQLTPDAEVSARRLLGAAESAHQSGHVHASLNCLEAALRRASAGDLRLDIEHMLGRVAARSGSAARARDGLLAAAVRCETHDPAKAAELLADAVLPCLRAGAPLEACRVARRSMQLAHGMGGRAELLATVMLGTALLFTGDYAAGAELLDQAGELVAREELAGDGQLRAYVGAGLAYAGRHEPARTLLGSVIEQARAEGAVGALPYALVRLAGVELAIGRWAAAAGALHEALRLAEETGHSADHGLALGTLAWLEAAKGEAESCRAHVDDALELAGRLGRGSQLDRAAAALGLLELGLGHPDAAIPHLEHVHRLQEEQGWSDASVAPHVSPDLVEAYVLDGRREDPAAVSERFSADAERSRRPSALAAAARCRAFLSDESQLDTRFAEALAAREEVTGPFERARTSLLYGTRLAASGRRDAAGAPLNIALATFEHLGAEPWAERARREIIRIGSTPPGRKPRPLDRLTSQELEVVLATAEGAYPREVATRLFLGLRTVQLHLLSAVVKLDLSSPTELAGAISGRTPPAAR
jgi:DNA-binding CsgD family transcriptional regulator/tetratricopeptide (TPR) repeat protein